MSSVHPCHNTRDTGTALFVPAQNLCEVSPSVPQYPELPEVLYHFHTRARNFWKFCKTPILVPLPGIHKPHRTLPWNFEFSNFLNLILRLSARRRACPGHAQELVTTRERMTEAGSDGHWHLDEWKAGRRWAVLCRTSLSSTTQDGHRKEA